MYFSSWLSQMTSALTQNTPLCTMIGLKCVNSRFFGVSLNNNNMTGTLPASFSRLSALTSLDLSGNPGLMINTSILSNLTQLGGLVLYNTALSGSLAALRSLSSLTSVTLTACGLTGALDGSVFAPMTGLTYLFLTSNSLSSLTNVSLLPRSLQMLQVGSNALTGSLPSAGWCNLTALTYLDLSNNQLSGSIPSLSCMNLTYLDLKSNALTGVLGDDIVDAMDVCVSPCGGNTPQPQCKDMYLGLAANQLSGTVPASLTSANKSCIRQISVETPISVCAAGSYQSGTSTATSSFSSTSPNTAIGIGLAVSSGGGTTATAVTTWLKAACQLCSLGSFSAQPGAVSCSPCSAGYVSNQNFTGCVPCDAGKFLNQGACVPCGTGSISSAGSVACSLCPSNTYTNGSDFTACIACPLSSTSPAASGTLSACKCALGSIPVYAANSSSTFTCTPCPAGSYYDISTSGCAPCGMGAYSSAAGSTSCVAVDAGYVANVNSTGQTPCPAGTALDAQSGTCQPCAAGSYSALAGATECTLVDPGFVSTPQRTGQSACPAGTFLEAELLACVACAPGTYTSTAASSRCASCSAGTNAPLDGATGCQACPSNSRDAAAFTACLCSAGYFDAQLGANSSNPVCTACTDGGVCDGTTGELLADEGYWREGDNDTVFFKCREGYCLAENSSAANSSTARRRLHQASSNGSDDGGHCADGHGGVLCAVCQEGFSMQGGFCKACDAKDSWSNWSKGSKAALCACMVPVGALAITLLFLLPLLPACERGLQAMTDVLSSLAARVHGAVAAAMRCPARCFACLCVRKPEEAPAELIKAAPMRRGSTKRGLRRKSNSTLAAASLNSPKVSALLLQAAPEQQAPAGEAEEPDQGDRGKGGVSSRRLAAAPLNNPMVSALALQQGIASSGIIQAASVQEAPAEDLQEPAGEMEGPDQGDYGEDAGEGGIGDMLLVDTGGVDALLDTLTTLFYALSRPAKIIINFFQVCSLAATRSLANAPPPSLLRSPAHSSSPWTCPGRAHSPISSRVPT